jgi:hypothetical protein
VGPKYIADGVTDWKAKGSRSISYDDAGIEVVRRFIGERASLGYTTELPTGLSLGPRGFTFTGSPGTEPWYWETLGKAMEPELKEQLRELRSPLCS